jgi:cupin 2 domain-containing protein
MCAEFASNPAPDRRILLNSPGMKLHYFAYGSNLHPARLLARVPSAEFVEVAVWPDRELRFCKRSADGSAKCTLVPALGSRAFGAVYRLEQADKSLLDGIEGLGQGYEEHWQGLPLGEGVARTFHYAAADDYIEPSLQPYHWYKQMVLAGAHYHEFPARYIESIERVASIEDPDPLRRAQNEAILELCRKTPEQGGAAGPQTDARRALHASGNLFAGISADIAEEVFDTLARSDAVHIERIVSKGHASPTQGWFDSEHNEWVVLLTGAARIALADGREVAMAPGDWLEIPAHCKHRVTWTDPEQESLWLAVHYP